MLIAFNLSSSGNRYNAFKDTIAGLGQVREVMPSVWILRTLATPKRVLEYLHYHTESRDKIIAIQVGNDFAGNLSYYKIREISQLIS